MHAKTSGWAMFPILAAMAVFLLGCPPKYPTCKKDSHCEKKGEVCVENTCQQCRDNDQCTATDECKGGRCVPRAECAAASDCSGGKICRSGKCELECTSRSDCGSSLKCLENRCVDEMACSGPSDCSAGLTCSGGRCVQGTDASRNMGGCELTNVNFDFNKSSLSSEARDQLSAVAECMKEKTATITVEGHCDDRGTEEYNLALGEDRARSVQKYLISLGVPRSKLRIVSKGEVDPIDNASTESAWAKNRRAQFVEQ